MADRQGLSIDENQWLNGNGNPTWEPTPQRQAELAAMGYRPPQKPQAMQAINSPQLPEGALGWYNDPSSPYHGQPVFKANINPNNPNEHGYAVQGYEFNGGSRGTHLYARGDAPPPISTTPPQGFNDYGGSYGQAPKPPEYAPGTAPIDTAAQQSVGALNGKPVYQKPDGTYYTTRTDATGNQILDMEFTDPSGMGGFVPGQTATGQPVGGGIPLNTGGAPLPGTPGGTPAAGGTPATGAPASLPPEFQALYTQLETYLQELQRRGQVLNPNIEISPDQVAQFMTQAETEIAPYYQNLLKVAKDSFVNTLQYGKENLQRGEQNAETQYGRSLQSLGENSAERGFAQSGIRVRDEGNLASDTQQQIDAARSQLQYGANQAAGQFAQTFGTANLPTLDLGAAPTVKSGEYNFSSSGRTSPLYQLSPEVYNGLTGTNQFEQTAAVKSRASELEGAYRTQQAINQARQLTL